jgi:class 3 adenylate cyclase/ribosomal protein L23
LSTDKDKLQELLEQRRQMEQELEKLKTPMTILFSDIKGSTAYAEKNGDIEYMSMINRHNDLLFPVIQAQGGRVVKTIGDAILAQFDDPVGGIKAAAGMQQALAEDREGKAEIDQIRIRVGLHYGLGLIKDDDVFGDVVNAASRVQHQADTEQILITDVLLDAAKAAGFECARIGRAEMKGKYEPIDLYAVAWSESAAKQLIEDVHARYEKRLKDFRKQQEALEEEFEHSRDQWRAERRNLRVEIEQLEEAVERARQTARQQLSEDVQSELHFQLEQAILSRQQLEQDLTAARQKFEAERNNLKAQIASMQGAVLEAMERSNNPSRMTAALRDQVDARVAEAKQDWNLQWESERKRFAAEIERLKKLTAPGALDQRKETARRALLEKLGKVPAGSSGPPAKSAGEWEAEFQDAKIHWGTERDQLELKIKRLDTELQRAQDSLRSEIYQEVRSQYEPKLAEANRDRQRLEHEIVSFTNDLSGERQRLEARIHQLEQALPVAQEATRKQAQAELQAQFDVKLDEVNRLRVRAERKSQDKLEELEGADRRARKQIAALEEQLKEAKEAVFKAQKSRATS